MEYHLALAGDPVEHSLSPTMHTAALKASGLSGSYVLERCSAAGLRDLVDKLREGRLQGLNVTMPHKRRAAELAEELTPVARLAGSVNSLKGVAGRVWGHSTDAIAFQRILGSARFPPDAPVLILGAGGTAAAALAVTERRVTLSARRAETAVELAARFPNAEPRLAEFGSVIPGAVVVNATPLGMRGEDLPAGILESASGLIDLAYGPGETPAVDLARHRGLSFVDGYEFLALQAAESFRWWTGKVVDVAVMISAARNL